MGDILYKLRSLLWNPTERKQSGGIPTNVVLMPWYNGGSNTQESGLSQPTDFEAQIQAYKDVVYACTRINSQAVASVPLILYANSPSGKGFKYSQTRKIDKAQKEYMTDRRLIKSQDDTEEIVNHPFIDLMKNVNPVDNEFDLKEITTSFMDLTGNTYWYLLFNRLRQPVQIQVIPPQYMKVIPDQKTIVGGYVYTRSQKDIKFTVEEICHFRYKSPANEFYGMGNTMGAALDYNLRRSTALYNQRLLDNGGIPHTIIIPETRLPEQNRERVEQQFKLKWGSGATSDSSGGIAVLNQGLRVEQLGLAPKDMSYAVARKETLEGIAMCFGVPKALLTSETVNRATYEASLYQHRRDTILPICTRIEQKITEKILPFYGNNLFVAFENPVPEDKEFELEERKVNLESGYMSINEARAEEGLEPVAWGDVPMSQNATNTDTVRAIAAQVRAMAKGV